MHRSYPNTSAVVQPHRHKGYWEQLVTESVPIAVLQVVHRHNLSAVMTPPRIRQGEVLLLWLNLLVLANYIGHRCCNTLH